MLSNCQCHGVYMHQLVSSCSLSELKALCPVFSSSPSFPLPLCSYFTSKCRFQHLFVPMYPPGRTMQLRRLKDAAPTKRRLSRCGGCKCKCRRGRPAESWDAVWVAPEQVMEEGILLSSSQNSDHSTARLAGVLEELVQQAGSG